MHANLTRRAAIQWSGAAFALPVVQLPPAYLENGMPFTPKFVDLVRNFTAVQGTGPVALGSAVSGYTSLAAALSAGDQFYYCIQGVDKPQEREVGRGTMQADGRIAREAVQGELTHFTGGTKTIALVTAAEWFTQASAGASIEVASRAALAAAASTRGPAFLNERGREGLFAWDPGDHSAKVALDAQQGLHVAPASDPTGASGAWIRRFEGPANPLWFGLTEGDASGANGAANSAALAAMFGTLRARAVNDNGTHRGLEGVRFPVGHFEFDETIELTEGTLLLEGADTGFRAARGTILKFPAGVTGIRVQRYNTSGPDTTDGVTHRGGDGSVIRDLALVGAFAGTDAEAHGIQLRARARIENVFIETFEGDGIHGDATAGGSPEGNTNNTQVFGGRLQGCRTGLYINGSDSNIWTVIGLDSSTNRQWGIWDSSFLGNTFLGCHTSANGFNSDVNIPTMCSFGGIRYYVKPGQDVGASTNAPTGTTSDNTWWAYFGVGAASAPSIVDWVSGTEFREGGSYKTDNANAASVFLGCYAEGGQPSTQIAAPSAVFGGALLNEGAGAHYKGGSSGATLGYRTGPARNFILTLNNRSATSQIDFVKNDPDGAGTTEANILTASNQLILNWNGAHPSSKIAFRITNTERARLTLTALQAATDNTLDLGVTAQRWKTVFGYTGDFTTQVKVGGIKVLGAQGAAVADAPTLTAADAATAAAAPTQAEFNALVAEFNKLRSDLGASRSQLNLALARLRVHGLIAE